MNFPASQTNRELSTLSFDPELTPGARNAVNICLRIQPSEKVTVITDDATKEIAASLLRELETLGAPYRAWVLEELAPRPLTDLPRDQPGQHLRGAGPDQRTAVADADD